MKKFGIISIILGMICTILTLSSCVCLPENLLSSLDNAAPGDVKYKDITIDNTQTTYGPLALVNDSHEYKFPTEPLNNLVNIWDYRIAHTNGSTPYKVNMDKKLDGTAMHAVHTWLSDFHKATGKGDAIIVSAYRTAEEQASYSIPVGQSDHHTGFGVTIKIYDGTNTYDFDHDPEYKEWLTQNAYKYGLVVRYPADKSDITHISDYENYFHYVGYGPAKYMHDNNLCLEEFVASIKSHSVDNPLAVTDANKQDWLIYYAACPGDIATIKVPSNFTYTISGDNEGGVIICVSLSKSAAEQQQQAGSETAAQ
jgi:D-alanyl-D-alanine carboxypeptidase